MVSITEVLQLCRLCLMKDQVNTPIFEDEDDISQIFLKISACLHVKVSREDNLPKNICDSCSYKLELFYEFLNTSIASEKQLTTWLNQLGTEKAPVSKAINTLPASHTVRVSPIILKQEVPELIDAHSVDDLGPVDLNISETQDYVLQQQQLPYEGVEFEFQQEGFMDSQAPTNMATSTTITSKGIAVPPSRKRRAASLKALHSELDSEDDDDDDLGLVGSKITKTEDDSDSENDTEQTFVDLPSESADNDQPGPSGVGKTDSPFWNPVSFPIKLEQPDHEVDAKNGLWVCNVCGQSFANNSDVIDHVYNAALEMYICCRCGSKFVDEKTFRLHLRDHKMQSLQLRQKGYNDVPTCFTGKIIDSRVNNTFICKYCDLPFKDRAVFYNHSIGHTTIGKTKPKSAKNLVENKITEIKNNMNVDFKVEKLYYGIKYRCKKCQMAFYNLDRNTTHADKCVGFLKRCDVCCTVFNSNLKLFEHYEVVHSDFKRMCKFCFETFTEDKTLIHHIIKLHLKFSHYCYDCNEGFVSMHKFNNHVKKHCW